MSDVPFERLKEILRETYEGGVPGEGTEYLDHASGIRSTLRGLSAERASARTDGHPSIAAHARHMAFHLRVVTELEDTRAEFLRVMGALEPERLAGEGAGLGAIAHLAYHLGAIRQLVHRV